MRPTFIGQPVPWEQHGPAVHVLESDLARFVDATGDDDWSIVWARGSGVVGSTAAELDAETRIVEHMLTSVRSQRPRGRGALFLSSSAGGAYAGSDDPPFTESTVPRPLSPYGETKLAQEEL